MTREVPRLAFRLMLFLCFASTGLAQIFDGEVIQESVSREHCNTFSGETVDVPGRVVLEQVFLTDQLPAPFEIYARSTYRGQPGVNRGRIVVRARLVQRDGTVIPLPTLKARIEDGEAYAWRSYVTELNSIGFEVGDRILWVGKLKKHLPTDRCWRLEMGILAGGPAAP